MFSGHELEPQMVFFELFLRFRVLLAESSLEAACWRCKYANTLDAFVKPKRNSSVRAKALL